MIYSEKITLEQAISITKTDLTLRCFSSFSNSTILLSSISSTKSVRELYEKGCILSLTRNDYATFIIGNKPVPEGYGYPSKELGSRIYDSLPYKFHIVNNKWNKGTFSSYGELVSTVELKWYEVAFPLTDLARVEAEAEKPFADSTDWKAKYEAQAAELDEIRTRLRRSSDEVSERKEMLGELKLQLQEATASADSKQDRINELEAELKTKLEKLRAELKVCNDSRDIAIKYNQELASGAKGRADKLKQELRHWKTEYGKLNNKFMKLSVYVTTDLISKGF